MLEVETGAEEPPEQSETSTEAYDQVLTMTKEAPETNTAELDGLREEVHRLKALLAAHTARTEEVEKENEDSNIAREKEFAEAEVHMESVIRSYKEQLLESADGYQLVQASRNQLQKKLLREIGKHVRTKVSDRSRAEENNRLRTELKEKDQQLEAAQKAAAATAKAQVMKIWAEMKKAKAAADGKRKGSEDMSEPQAKKARFV